MKLDNLAIKEIAKEIKDIGTGSYWVDLFNVFGSRDIYDQNGLPDIGLLNGCRPSKKDYIAKRLEEHNDSYVLRQILERIVIEHPEVIDIVNQKLKSQHYQIIKDNDQYVIDGGVIEVVQPVTNIAHFNDIQKQILDELDAAQVSIKVVMAWFTNQTLADKLIEKYNEGLDVSVLYFRDGVNKQHGVDLGEIPTKGIRSDNGGIMHNKFCVIDNQVVITGSYNWSENAEFRNDENITIQRDSKSASKYSVEYRRLEKNV